MRNSLIPANTLGSLDRGFGRLFDELFEGFGLVPSQGKLASVPALDLIESDGSFRVEMDLPGVREEDVQISLENGVLEVRAEKKVEERDDDEEPRYVERRTTSFARRLHLPGDVDAEGVEATLKDGVLKVTLPKQAHAQPKRIEVRRG